MMLRLFRRLALTLPLSLLAVLFYAHSARAANFNYSTVTTYMVESEDSARVTQQYTVTNRTSQFYLTEIKITTPTDKISDLRVAYQDGSVIPSAVTGLSRSVGDVKFGVQEINLRFPRQNYGFGRSWVFTISYLAGGVVESKGGAHTVYIPAVELNDPADDYRVVLDVPATFGRPHFVGTRGTSRTSGDRQLYGFDKSQVTTSSLALAFGDTTVYRFNFNFPLHNPSPWPRKLTISLPPDLVNQRSYLDRLDPAPDSVTLDADGNVRASYLLAPRQQLEVKADVSGQTRYLEYDLTRSGKRSDIPPDLVRRYTAATRYWPTSGEVAEAARALNDDQAPVINNVKAVYQFVINKLSYNNDKIKFNIRQGADKALANPSNAVCLEYSDLLVAMLRSIGIPARMPVGYAYSGSLKESKGITDSLHSWVEAYVPGVGWISLDPTWGEKFDQFGRSDLDHFAFAVWGENDQAPEAVMAGRLTLDYQYENASLSYDSKLTDLPDNDARLSVKRWAVLPLLSLDRVTLTAPSRVATDSNLVQIGSRSRNLGSLAPTQTVRLWQWQVGANASSFVQSSLYRQEPGQVLLASAKATPSYWPMGLLAALFVVTLTLVVIRLRSKPRLQTRIKNQG